MTNHIVQQGETLSQIAKKYYLASWETIYNHPDNAEFRRNRPNHNLIYPGDEVFVPERELRVEDGSTEQKHRFQVQKPRQVLRIAVEDILGERIADTDYELLVKGQIFRGKTDSEGLLEERIPVDAVKGKLKVGTEQWDLLIGHLNPVDENTRDGGVSGAQARLKNLGYAVGKIDGILSPKTRAALEAFQSDENLEETGRLDDETRRRLVQIHNI